MKRACGSSHICSWQHQCLSAVLPAARRPPLQNYWARSVLGILIGDVAAAQSTGDPCTPSTCNRCRRQHIKGPVLISWETMCHLIVKYMERSSLYADISSVLTWTWCASRVEDKQMTQTETKFWSFLDRCASALHTQIVRSLLGLLGSLFLTERFILKYVTSGFITETRCRCLAGVAHCSSLSSYRSSFIAHSVWKMKLGRRGGVA